jgi:hypothetical protein
VLVRIVLVLVALLAGLVAAPVASAQEEPQLLSGAIRATDGRAVNALIGFDFLDEQGRKIRRDGCVQSPECPFVGYGGVLRVNENLPAEGAVDPSGWTTSWTMQAPPGTVQVFLEAYPQNASYKTDESRYGHAMRHSVKLPTDGPVDVLLPLVLCDEGGTVGSITGTAVKEGAPHSVRRVVAWSLDAYDPETRPVLGWNIGTARADGTSVVPNLPPDQRYQVWLTAEDGTVRKTFGVAVNTCAETRMEVSFDPPPEPSATPTATVTPSPEPLPPSAPTVEQPVISAGQSAGLTGAAEPGSTVELWAYSRPSTTYRLVRTTVASPSGLYAFSVTPPTDTRLHVRVGGLESASTVVGVRHLVRMGVTRTGERAYRFAGTVFPARAGVRVDVLARTPSGLRPLTAARTGADGRWAVDRRFTGTATWDVFARSAADGVNRPGASAPVRLAIR